MAKFCTKCGKPLVDGKPCSCSKEDEEVKEKEVVAEEQDDDDEIEEEKTEKKKKKVEDDDDDDIEKSSNELVNTIVDIYKNVWKSPNKTMEKYSEKNTKLSICLILINVIVFGLLLYFLVNNTYKGIINDMIQKLTQYIAIGGSAVESTLGISQSELTSLQATSLPFGTLFIYGIVCMAICYLILVVFTWLFNSVIFKGKGTFAEHLGIVAIASPLPCIIMILSILISFISYKFALLIASGALITFFVAITHCYLEILPAKQEKLCYSQTLSIYLTSILSLIIIVVAISIGIYNYTSSLVNQINTSSSSSLYGTSYRR